MNFTFGRFRNIREEKKLRQETDDYYTVLREFAAKLGYRTRTHQLDAGVSVEIYNLKEHSYAMMPHPIKTIELPGLTKDEARERIPYLLTDYWLETHA